ncbi:magnesium transporter CorA family protein [Romboutsia sp. 1001713B170131_170501_G6]|uniref:magnesium transporter CorA family protein n=1 Tax=Romboutsia sp. 1001713B170131_170501_G6 TaxID=2787108 RepID=UPI0018AA638C|nr:CorA family divalent cation transporter [Romboutsia sp. 1001713B170131_170501_G6]
MYILNLDTRDKYDSFNEVFYNKNSSYIILSNPKQLNMLKDILEIDEITFNDCLRFDENIKLDLFDKYDFLSINTFEIINNDDIYVEEINIYLSENFVLVVCNEENFIFEFVKNIITNNIKLNNTSNIFILFKVNYLILKNIIMHQFEILEKIEDIILKLEDDILENAIDEHVIKINHIRGITRSIVKNTRPLLYIGDRILKENIRYLKYSDIRKQNLENFQSIDFGIEKLYSFSLSTRELADKLLDIYASQVAEKTNSLITKLTLLTAISSPLTIITGIYGMNFRFMPELDFVYAYPIVITVMIIIVIIGILIFKLKKLL